MIDHPFRPPADLDRFYVVTSISNPQRYQRRYELYHGFAALCASAGVKLVTVEQAFGLRPHMVTRAGDPMHVQVRTVEELWHKENMLNLGIRRSTEMGAREVAWVDADCAPMMAPHAWFEETWHALQHHEFVQMWEWLQDLDLNHNPLGPPQPSFMANYVKHGSPNHQRIAALERGRRRCYPYGPTIFGRPGLAWAANVDAINRVGGLLDCCILGAGDWYMAWALIGALRVAAGQRSSSAYVRRLYRWQELCERWIKRDVGHVRGSVVHHFHGRKVLRQYGTRGNILLDNRYDPDTDVKYDSQGLLQLETWEPRQIRLRDQIRAYFRARREDSTAGGEGE